MSNTNYKRKQTKVFFGTRKEDGVKIYLTLPEWNCDWYWGFGYLGNKDEHYHLDGYQDKQRVFFKDGKIDAVLTERRNVNMHDVLLADYELSEPIKTNLWVFCELVLTAYSLRETAEILGRGGSHMTTNPCKNIIINKDEADRINNVVLPSIFEAIENIVISKEN